MTGCTGEQGQIHDHETFLHDLSVFGALQIDGQTDGQILLQRSDFSSEKLSNPSPQSLGGKQSDLRSPIICTISQRAKSRWDIWSIANLGNKRVRGWMNGNLVNGGWHPWMVKQDDDVCAVARRSEREKLF